MADDPSTQITAAELRGAEMLNADPRAIAARFDAASGLINVRLSNGCSFAFPTRLAQGLEEASPDVLTEVEILGPGYGLHWETLDVDLSIPGLLAGLLGTKAFMDRQSAASDYRGQTTFKKTWSYPNILGGDSRSSQRPLRAW
jgi:hypothetical protein